MLSHKKYGKLTQRSKRTDKKTQRKNGKIKKPVIRYRKITDQVADKWDNACRICSQANNFNKAIKDLTDQKVQII